MAIEVKEIIVRTTINEDRRTSSTDLFSYKKLKSDILNELKKDIRRYDKRKKER